MLLKSSEQPEIACPETFTLAGGIKFNSIVATGAYRYTTGSKIHQLSNQYNLRF